MPELPEVETVLQGIKPYIEHKTIRNIVIRQPKLRWAIPKGIARMLKDQRVIEATRRGKYMLLKLEKGTVILHLGMSGSLKVMTQMTSPDKHDHFDIVFDDICLRFTDARRFGAFLYTADDPDQHPLLKDLGIEPLRRTFTGHYLQRQAKGRKIGVKQFIMNQKIVVGVGNIYAAEALFIASLHPMTPVDSITLTQFEQLARAIKTVLQAAIKKGGTTLRDFKDSKGRSGYFKQKLNVYDRAGQPCYRCNLLLELMRIQNRSTVFCKRCQPIE